MRHVIRPKPVLGWCLFIALAFGCAHVVTQYYRIKMMPGILARAQASPTWPSDPSLADRVAANIRNPRGLIDMFDLDREDNLPNTWSVLQLAGASALLFLLAGHSRTRGDGLHLYWKVLAVVFFILSLDEGASMHNNLHVFSGTQKERNARGIFYFSWVIPAGLATAAYGIAQIRFLWRLPAKTRWGMILSGAAYVASAVGGEMVEGRFVAHGGSRNGGTYSVMTLCEEVGEMVTIAAFLWVLLDYAQKTGFTSEITVPPLPDRAADLVDRPVADL